MSWNKVITIEKGALAGKKMTVGDFSGIMPFVDYSTDISWFPQVNGQDNNFRYANYAGHDIENFKDFITQTLGAGTHLIAAIRTSELDVLHPQAGTFICISFYIRDITTSGDEVKAFIGVRVDKKVYDNAGIPTTSYPLGNYFPESEYDLQRSAESTAQFPWTVYNQCKIVCSQLTHGLEKNLVVGIVYGHPNGNATCWAYNACRMKQSYFKSTNGWGTDAEVPEGEEYSPEFGSASKPGGYGYDGLIGSHDKHSDHSGIPSKPQYGFTSTGFLNHYKFSPQGLEMLGEALFPEPVLSSTSVQEAIDKLIANQWNSKVLDYVVDCRVIPVTPAAPNLENISCGGKVLVHPTTHLPYSAYLITEDFVDVDCGTITTPLVEGNFLDFMGLHCKIFLPFYGFIDIDPEYWNGATIGIYYRFNCMDGSFMVWITSKAFGTDMSPDDVIGQYSGNACIHLPISSQSYSQIVNGLITTGASIVGTAASGDVIGTAISAASGAEKVANSRPTLNKSNSYSGSSSMMSKRTPYLLIEFNEAQFSTKYVSEQGLPAIVPKKIGQCHGFTQALNPILDGIPCTDDERQKIKTLLASGIYCQ